MKAKVSRGGGFRGALNYVFDVGKEATHTKNAERVGGNMAGMTPANCRGSSQPCASCARTSASPSGIARCHCLPASA
jgi:hypothetical protein